MLKKLLLAVLSFVSATFAAMQTPSPFSFVFIVDSNYVPHCAETIFTLKATMPNTNKNAIIIMPDIDKNSETLLTTLSDEHTSVILREIETIDCIDRNAMETYKTSWSPLINLRWQLVSVIDWLNNQHDFIEKLFDKKPISTFVSLDSDLWVLQDLSGMFNVRGKHPILSSPLSPISLNNYEEIVLHGESSPMPMGVSSGVLLFHRDEIDNSEEFTKSISERLEEDWNKHKLFTSKKFCLMTKIFLDQNEESKEFIRSFLKEFLEKTKKITVKNESYGNLMKILQELEIVYKKVPQEFIVVIKDIIEETSNINWHFDSPQTNELFDFLLDPYLEKTTNKETLDKDYDKALQMFPADETALEYYTDVETLTIKYNFNPKDLFPALFTGNESAEGYPKFPEIHKELIKNEQIRKDVYTNAKDIMIFHFDGTIKPWNTERLANAIESDPKIGKIQEFYNKIRERSLTLADLQDFREFLSEVADSRLS